MFIHEYLGSIDLLDLPLKVIRGKHLFGLLEADHTRTVDTIFGIAHMVLSWKPRVLVARNAWTSLDTPGVYLLRGHRRLSAVKHPCAFGASESLVASRPAWFFSSLCNVFKARAHPIFIVLFSHMHKSCQNIKIMQCHVANIISSNVPYLRNVGYFTSSWR